MLTAGGTPLCIDRLTSTPSVEPLLAATAEACKQLIVVGCVKRCDSSRALQTELMRVDIETSSTLAAGQTVCDVWHQSGRPRNVTVARVRRVCTVESEKLNGRSDQRSDRACYV